MQPHVLALVVPRPVHQVLIVPRPVTVQYYLVKNALSLVVDLKWCEQHPIPHVMLQQQCIEHCVNSQCNWQIQFDRIATNCSYHLERSYIQGP